MSGETPYYPYELVLIRISVHKEYVRKKLSQQTLPYRLSRRLLEACQEHVEVCVSPLHLAHWCALQWLVCRSQRWPWSACCRHRDERLDPGCKPHQQWCLQLVTVSNASSISWCVTHSSCLILSGNNWLFQERYQSEERKTSGTYVIPMAGAFRLTVRLLSIPMSKSSSTWSPKRLEANVKVRRYLPTIQKSSKEKLELR